MDDYGLHRIVASKYFGKSSSDLHMAFANVVQKLCIDLVETIDFSILPLNIVGQKPRTWNHGIGEVLSTIAGKAILSFLKGVIKCNGTLQVCAGQEAHIKAAINSMNMMYAY